ncbi:hypothetical protein HDU97_005728 [Phlyctochytrium planicorne]|nr:hypothetical protein HDU97_005728 [Phlyctochytrium planicorne]
MSQLSFTTEASGEPMVPIVVTTTLTPEMAAIAESICGSTGSLMAQESWTIADASTGGFQDTGSAPLISSSSSVASFSSAASLADDDNYAHSYDFSFGEEAPPNGRGSNRSLSAPSSQRLPKVKASPLITIDGDQLPSINLSASSRCQRNRCSTCNSPMGVLIYYPSASSRCFDGSSDDFPAIDMTCTTCWINSPANSETSGTKSSPQTVGAAISRRKHNDLSMKKRRVKGIAKGDNAIHCEACNRKMGFGGYREGFKSEEGATNGRANVEPVCEACIMNFDFCSQCGGGGTFRTGRWRPRKLFLGNRRTCTLSHDRIGAVNYFQVTTYKCPDDSKTHGSKRPVDDSFDPQPVVSRRDSLLEEYFAAVEERLGSKRRKISRADAIDDDADAIAFAFSGDQECINVLRERRDQFQKVNRIRLMGSWATPAYMATYEELMGSWEMLSEYFRQWDEKMCRTLMGSGAMKPKSEVVNFLVACDALRPAKLASVGRSTKNGKSAKMGRKRKQRDDADSDDDEPTSSAASSMAEAPSLANSELVLVGYFFGRFYTNKRHVGVSQIYYDGKDVQPSAAASGANSGDDLSLDETSSTANSPIRCMFSGLVDRVKAEMIQNVHDEPEHVWVSVPRAGLAERNRHIYHLERLGFMSLTKYCSKNGYTVEALDAVLVEEGADAEDVLAGRHMAKMVMRWKDLVRRF